MVFNSIISSTGGGAGTAASGSGIMAINSETGPYITLAGDNSIDVTVPSSNNIQISCSGFVSGIQTVVLSDLGGRLDASGQIILSDVVLSIGPYGGADIKGDVDLSSTSGFIIIGDTAGSSPITFDVDAHALSGLWFLNQMNLNKLAIEASGQYIWNEVNVSGQLLLSDIAASGQLFLPREDADWNGFFNRTDSTISFNHSTRQFSIAPTGTDYSYYMEGHKYTSTGDNLTISADEGLHYIYYDASTLTEVVNPNLGQVSTVIRTKALVSAVYWSVSQTSGVYLGEERHGLSMSPVTHAYEHFHEGLRYTYGLGLNNITAGGNGTVDDYAVFGVDVGAVSDEDIYHAVTAVGSGVGLPIYYWTGATPNWNRWTNPGFSVRTFDGTSSTRLAYNQYTGGSWQLTQVDNTKYVLCHVFATTELNYPMIAIMGQNQYATLVAAQDGATTEIFAIILNEILIPEFRPIATLIFQTRDIFSNSVKARIVSTADGDDYIDWRNENIARVSLTTSEHNDLNGLQGGQSNEYYHLTSNEYSTFTKKYYQAFANTENVSITHNLGTSFIDYKVYASGTIVEEIIPDQFKIIDDDNASLTFNSNTTGFVVVVG